ncbi:MAG: hypothetical protein ACRDSH_18880, partial [Pseudonocardiaceae bacterium]
MTWQWHSTEDHQPRPATRKVISVVVLFLLAVVSCGTTASPSQAPTATTRTVTDTAGQLVEVPTKITGSIRGPDAAARAGHYVTYLNQSEKMVRARTDPIPAGQRPSVVHLAKVTPQLWV